MRTQLPRILIVDDNPDLRSTIRTILADVEYECVEAGCSSEALAAMLGGDFDVVFLDIQLPDGDGLDLLATARGLGKRFGRVIVLTGDAGEESRRRSEELGATDYLSKSPVEWKAICQACERALSGANTRDDHA